MLVAVLVFIACLLAWWWCVLIVVVIWFVGLLVIRLFVVWCGVVGLGLMVLCIWFVLRLSGLGSTLVCLVAYFGFGLLGCV